MCAKISVKIVPADVIADVIDTYGFLAF